MPARQTVGILGLGAIGRAAARNLLEDGFAVSAIRRPSSVDFPDWGGKLVDDAAALARDCDVVISCLANEAAMRAGFLAADGLVAGARPGLIVVEMSTFPVALKQELATALQARGATMLDSPISGTPPVVARRQGALFVSGDPAAVERCAAVLGSVAPKHPYVGAFGAGMAVKLVANFLVFVNTLATAEAMLLGTSAGIDPKVLIDAVGSSFAGTPVFNFRAPMMAERRYQPAPGPGRIMWKDLQFIRAQSDSLGLAGPLLDTTMQWFERLIAAGRGEDEGAAVYELLEQATRSKPA